MKVKRSLLVQPTSVKTVKLQKLGTGLKVSDEVLQYVNINILSLYMEDFGVKLNIGLDSLAIDTLINGDQADGSLAAPVIGVKTPNTLAYVDLLKAWVRMNRLGRMPSGMLSGEDMFILIHELQEFKGRNAYMKDVALKMQTPIPQTAGS